MTLHTADIDLSGCIETRELDILQDIGMRYWRHSTGMRLMNSFEAHNERHLYEIYDEAVASYRMLTKLRPGLARYGGAWLQRGGPCVPPTEFEVVMPWGPLRVWMRESSNKVQWKAR